MDQVNIRAVLVSHFPPAFTHETLIPKMNELGVQVDQVVNAERNKDFGLGSANLVICMRDYMSHSSYDAAKDAAKKASLPFVALTRKSSDWESKLGVAVKRIQAARVPAKPKRPNARFADVSTLGYTPPEPISEPVTEPEEPPEATTDELRELLAMFEEDNTKLGLELKAAEHLAASRQEEIYGLMRQHEANLAQFAKDFFNKQTLLEGLRVLADLKAEKPGAMRAVLGFAHKTGLTIPELLELVGV